MPEDKPNRLQRYFRKAVYEWKLRREELQALHRARVFNAWLDQLVKNPPEVLIGANFAAFGGVRNHLLSIQRYSSLNIQLAPPEQVLRHLNAHSLTHEFRNKFWNFPAREIRVCHSHVFPWFIEWCNDKREAGFRWVHTYHLNYYPEHGNGALEPWQVAINDALINVARYADVRLSVSKWQAEELYREHGITTQYLPNGVDVARCDAANPARFRRNHKLDHFILYVGRNDPVKNPAEFVRLAQRLPEFRFVMIGGGLDSNSLRVDWQVDVPLNLLVLDELPHEQVQDALAACSVLVVTSKREGLPTLVMEAMAHSKPVVVPDEPGCMEVIGDGEAGIIYQLGNINDLSRSTLEAMAAKGMGERGRNRVLVEYDWRVIARSLDEIYLA